MDQPESHLFDKIIYANKTRGRFKVSVKGLAFQSSEQPTAQSVGGSGAGATDSTEVSFLPIQAANIRRVTYSKAASRGNQLRVELNDGNVHRFEGFTRDDITIIGRFTRQNYDLELTPVEHNVRGHNWGDVDFKHSHMVMTSAQRELFLLPYSDIISTTIMKNEVTLEMKPVADARSNSEQLVDIRFFVPQGASGVPKPSADEDDTNVTDDDEGAETTNRGALTSAGIFYEHVKERIEAEGGGAFGLAASGASSKIATLSELSLLIPRGRFDVVFYEDFLRLHGKTYTHRIKYEQILTALRLPMGDSSTDYEEETVYYVLGLKTPILQGQTSYEYVIISVPGFWVRPGMPDALPLGEDYRTVEVSLTDEVREKLLIRSKHAPGVPMVQDLYENRPLGSILHDLLTGLASVAVSLPVPLTMPVPDDEDSAKFLPPAEGWGGIKCSYKAFGGGRLYPVRNGLLYVPRPTVMINFRDVLSVKFLRITKRQAGYSNEGTFDVQFTMRSDASHDFRQLPAGILRPFCTFLENNRVLVPSEAGLDDGSDYDEERGPIKRQRTGPDMADGGPDDDSEEDTDFVPSESGSDSGSASSGSSSSDDDYSD
ncbi:hypothetical protein H696_03587 [Fonticula alba]|uniref:Histone chaperone RTT106/FACT complex subunit SPT16-like middle domain-containing protein n=1 Tax=Fonticula alba TaxID=691883 RepID=A0A058Z7P1_FONAL|nr:hypothetical protein H696_03587 [Fonticula alba]KCV70126.1 hypothetical protein H696_03587 [Fonticula alba]|eukprot:XP_009495732.1 hypothetical protein H696_03587 [Fonticula alba]